MTELEWIEIFSGNLTSIMSEIGITQNQLAKAAGISKSLVSDYVNGKRMPTVKTIVNIIEAIPEKDPEDLFHDLIYFDDRIV